jgi:hypothetical protein
MEGKNLKENLEQKSTGLFGAPMVQSVSSTPADFAVRKDSLSDIKATPCKECKTKK